MFLLKLNYFLQTAIAVSLLMSERTQTIEVSLDLAEGIIRELIAIVYSIPIFENVACNNFNSSSLVYYLYTPSNRDDPVFLNATGANNVSVFNPSFDTKFLTHGWLSEVNDSWLLNAKDAYLDTGNYNVILLDWSSYSSNLYSVSACYVEQVGYVNAQLIDRLRTEAELDLNRTHLIGHSLGGHIMGFTGKFVQNFTNGDEVNRITGLDAAGPLLCSASNDPVDRLSIGDAYFVDGIHTNDGTFGCDLPYGNADFYPNCGSQQSGCSTVDISILNVTGSVTEAFDQLSCSHGRSHVYWVESIRSRGSFRSRECPTCPTYIVGLCGRSEIEDMGEYCSTTAEGPYYLLTSNSAPYGRN